MQKLEIPLACLETHIHKDTEHYRTSIQEQEIEGVQIEHVALSDKITIDDSSRDGYKSVYIFVEGKGDIVAAGARYEIVPETIFLPNAIETITISSVDSRLHYLKISCKLSAQDQIDLGNLPKEHTQNVYCAKFSDCPSYSESIKSPNTVSRTILSNEYIPRVAMGTVKTTGPDKVVAHKHPMLEQLFLGLSDNHCVVYADNNEVDFPPYSILHIPLGSIHSVSVERGKALYYVWMDFFLNKEGEDWLKTHKVDSDNTI